MKENLDVWQRCLPWSYRFGLIQIRGQLYSSSDKLTSVVWQRSPFLVAYKVIFGKWGESSNIVKKTCMASCDKAKQCQLKRVCVSFGCKIYNSANLEIGGYEVG
jgi:hypothetical protein